MRGAITASGFRAPICRSRSVRRTPAVNATPIGPPNGLFYELAGDRPSSFWDIVHGNNRYLSRVPWFRAKRGYDLASGLGVPKFSVLASRLPRPAPSESAR